MVRRPNDDLTTTQSTPTWLTRMVFSILVESLRTSSGSLNNGMGAIILRFVRNSLLDYDYALVNKKKLCVFVIYATCVGLF